MLILDPVSAIQKTGDMKSAIFTQIWITIKNLNKVMETSLNKRAGISSIQFAVLHAIIENDGVLRPSQIAEWISTERHNVSTLMKRMEHSELIKIKRNKKRKVVTVYITEKGRSLFISNIPKAREIINDIMGTFSDE
jgi:DNA-binding MarR family transcriptional regulator